MIMHVLVSKMNEERESGAAHSFAARGGCLKISQEGCVPKVSHSGLINNPEIVDS